MLFRICPIFAIAFLFCWNSCDAQSDFSTLRESWNQLNSELTQKQTLVDNGVPGAADDYRDLVDKANDLIESLRTRGLEELKAQPDDGQVIRGLLGIMVHDAQNNRDSNVLEIGQSLIDVNVNPKYFELAAKVDGLERSQQLVFEELLIRHKEKMANDLPRVKLVTSSGEIVLELFENEAPNTVCNFVSLIESGYYENKIFHRVIEDSIAQGGGYEIEGVGPGGPGYVIDCECKEADARRNFPGTISMAHVGRSNTGGSQFFFNFKFNKILDMNHTVFGRVISGFDTLEKIERTEISVNGIERPIEQAKPDKIISAEVLRKRDHNYRVRKNGEAEPPEEPKAETEMLELELEKEKVEDKSPDQSGPELTMDDDAAEKPKSAESGNNTESSAQKKKTESESTESTKKDVSKEQRSAKESDDEKEEDSDS